MNRNLAPILFIILIVGGIAAFIYYKKNYFPKYSWAADYKKNSDQPYGLKLFYTAVKNQEQKTTVIFNQSYDKLDTNQSNSNFIFVGNDFYVDSVMAFRILKYVEKGNRVLISSNYCPFEIVRNFVPIGDTIAGFDEVRDSIVSIEFTQDKVPFPAKTNFHFQFLKDTVAYSWNVYRKSYFKDTLAYYHFVPLSFLNDSNLNAFTIRHGKGEIIIHSNPILFTNYYMIRQNGFEHANNILSQLHSGPTYWDDPNSIHNESNNSSDESNNPLKFLFSHPSLKWAWYLLLFTILLYLVFRSKREQRIIPLMPVNTNASIEYTKAIGTLYFQNKGYSQIANEMYIIFLSDIRSMYNLSTDMPEAELTEQLSMRSGVNRNLLYQLFKQFKYVRTNTDPKEDDLINLYDAIDNYYKKRK